MISVVYSGGNFVKKKSKIKKNVDSKIQSSLIRKEDYRYEYESKTIECRDEAG